MKTHSQKGYSIIELLIYLALFAVLSVVIVRSLITVLKTYATAQGYRRLQNNGELVMERIVRETRSAHTISTSSVYGVNPGTLVLSETDETGTAHTVTIDVSNGAVQINDNGTIGALTTPEVTATNLVFTHITTTMGEALKVNLTLTTAKGYTVSAPFYTTVLPRGIK